MSVGIVKEESITLNVDLRLESGRILGPVTQVYETYGTLNSDASNAILVAHAWTGSAHLAGKSFEEDTKVGWWDAIVGPGRLLDTDRFFVICPNVIGSCYGSTGPASINPRTGKRYNLSFPVVTVRDMVRAQALLLDHLGINKLVTVLGGSMGGMQALEWGTQYPDRVSSIIALATTPAPSPQAISLNAIARWAIFNDPDWKEDPEAAHTFIYGTRPAANGQGWDRAVLPRSQFGNLYFIKDDLERLNQLINDTWKAERDAATDR